MRIATFSPISNKALESKELPKRIKVMSFGKSNTLDSPIYVNDKTLSTFNSTQKSIGRERVPIDFNHNTVPGSKTYESDKEPRAIAGYGTPKVNKDGLFLEDIQWTPSGEKAARDYEDLSPAPLLDKDDVVIGLHSVALTPAGAIDDLTFYSADTLFNNMKIKKLSALEEDKKALDKSKDLVKHEEDEIKGEYSAEDVVKEKHPIFCTCADCTAEKTISTHAYNRFEADENPLSNEKTEIKTMSANITPKAYETEPHEVKTFKPYMHEEIKKMAAELNLPDAGELEKRLKNLLAVWLGENGTEVPEGPIANKANSTPAQFSAEVKNLTNRLAVLENDRNEAIARYEAHEKQSIIADATRSGKIVPFSADEVKEISSKVLKSVCDKLPKQVPTKVTMAVLNADGKSQNKPTTIDAANAWQVAVDTAMARA